MLRQNVLNFARVDVVAAADDEFTRASGDRVVAIGATPAEIARLEPAIGAERLGGHVGALPVAREDVWPAHLDLANLAVRNGCAVYSADDARLLPWKRRADRAGTPLAIVGIGHVHDRLGHAVAFENALAEDALELREDVRAERRRAGDVEAQRTRQRSETFGLSQQTPIHRRHAEEHRDRRVGVDAWQARRLHRTCAAGQRSRR